MGTEILEQLNGMAVFVQVVDTGSFTGAARRLGLDKSAVSKHISRLEARLATRLLHRTTRALSLTETGRLLYDSASQSINALEETRLALSNLNAEPQGTLRVTVSVAYGRLCIAPLIPEFLARYPQLKVRLGLLDRMVDLADEGYDMAIRISSKLADGLVAKRLAPVPYLLCASPAYLVAHSRPRQPADLAKHNCLYYGFGEFTDQWQFNRKGHSAEKASVRVSSNYVVNSSETIRDALLAGMGVGLLPLYAVKEQLERGELIRLLNSWEAAGPFGGAAYAVWLPTRHLPPKVRLFVDFLAEKMAAP
ncbi:MAG TPA: LysR family transcriptional regulator [Rhodocyclaceae bacterium]|nr:LysR family transcriptional regulator [Rhodocyclaceae bacterium]